MWSYQSDTNIKNPEVEVKNILINKIKIQSIKNIFKIYDMFEDLQIHLTYLKYWNGNT